MRAVRFHSTGKPAEVLRVDEVPEPEPGPGEVRVRMTHRAINPADLHAIAGRYGKTYDLPAVAGHEGVGVVDAVGPDVYRVRVGQRVVPMGVQGTWQEAVVLPARACFPVPDEVPDEAAAQLFVNPLTALLMLETLALPEGSWLLQTGGTTQVGRIVVQLARHRGLRTISLVRRENAREELEALGADAVAVWQDETDAGAVQDTIDRCTDGRGVAGALDAVAGAAGSFAARQLAPGGTLLVYGGLSGEPLQLDAATLIYRRAGVQGFWRTAWFEMHPPGAAARRLAELAGLVAEGALRLPVAATYDLADVAQAVTHARRPAREGKVLLTG